MSAPLISFKAGRIDYNDDTKEAVPKRGQGTVKITKNPDEPSFYSFVWEPRGKYKRTVGASENDELLLFPGDAEWKHIKQCTTGRAYALTFKSSGQKLMFWMQTAGADDDIATLTADDKAISESISKILDEESMMEEDANEDIELADATDEPAPASNRPAISEQNLTDIIRSVRATAQTSSIPVTSIADAIPISTFVSHINSLSEEELQTLYEHLPEGIDHTREELVSVIQSSQFYQGMESLSSVLNQSGVGEVVASQLDYDYEGEGVEGFLNGARNKSKREKEE